MIRSFLSIFLLCMLSNAGAQTISAQLGKRVLILDNPPFESCHASTITTLKGNKLMAAWFAGKHEGSEDVSIWAAVYDKGKWGEPKEVANGIVNDTLRYPCWNPVLFRTHAGKLFLFYKVGKSPREWWGMMMTSTDNGKRWSAPERLPDGMLGPIKNKPIQLKNGDILYPSSTESADEKKWNIHLERSDRDGRNWARIPIDNDTFGVIQPSILRYPHDSLQLLCRSRQNFIVQSWSADNGATWGPLSATELPNPNSGTDAVTLKDGIQVMVYNPLFQGREWWEGRSRLHVVASEDGRKWKYIFTLENQPKGEYSYPAIIQAEDDLVHITYTAERKNIRHVVLHIARKEN